MADNEATKRPTIQDRYEEVARQRRREEAIARQKASMPVEEVAHSLVQSTPNVVL